MLVLAVTNARTTDAGRKFLEENAKKEGVVVLKSGLQYRVVKKGTSNKSPLVSTPCECHYEGRLIDGTVFDSSYKRGAPTTFAPNQVIKGWTEAMQLMHEGDKWELFIPSELAYGDAQRGQHITPGAVLVFDIEILKVIVSSPRFIFTSADHPSVITDQRTFQGDSARTLMFCTHKKTEKPRLGHAGPFTALHGDQRLASERKPVSQGRAWKTVDHR